MPGPHVWFCHADCGTQYSHRFWREQALEVTAGQTCRVAPPRPPSASADNVERKREKACPQLTCLFALIKFIGVTATPDFKKNHFSSSLGCSTGPGGGRPGAESSSVPAPASGLSAGH